MKKNLLATGLLALACLCAPDSRAQGYDPTMPQVDSVATAQPSEPFAFGDFSWLNGADRRKKALLETKYFTGSFLFESNYTSSNQNPIDNTVVGSSILARNNEVQIAFVGIGGDFHYDNVHARLMYQLGTRATVVPRNDASTARGQYDLANAYRYFSEAYAGYHFDKWHGINVDAGIFMSYIGLFSYYGCENWAYQPSFTSDNTPWFFNGVRVQAFPTDKFKFEVWLINGWQSYAKYNKLPGAGFELMWRPKEWFSINTNEYFGTDAANNTNRVRIHSDNSMEVRYLNHPSSKGINRMAFCLTGDVGCENGGGVSAFGGDLGPQQNFASLMFYNRTWFSHDHFGWTIGGGMMHNPGRYLVLLPTGDASPTGTHPFSANPGDKFDGWDVSTTLDWMPKENITWRLELVHREASVPYFAGPGGVTSPDGLSTTPLPAGWAPDLVKTETRIIGALLVRF